MTFFPEDETDSNTSMDDDDGLTKMSQSSSRVMNYLLGAQRELEALSVMVNSSSPEHAELERTVTHLSPWWDSFTKT